MGASRLEVRIPERLSERLEALPSSEGLTKTDVFRRAIASTFWSRNGKKLVPLSSSSKTISGKF
jgi:hypothetical protein